MKFVRFDASLLRKSRLKIKIENQVRALESVLAKANDRFNANCYE